MHSFHPKHSNIENRYFRYIRPQKSSKIAQKNWSLNLDLLNFFIGMVHGASSGPDGSYYVWERGVGGLSDRVTGGRSWPSFRDLSRCSCGVKDQSHSANFCPIALKQIEHGLNTSKPAFYLFQSDQTKIGVSLILWHRNLAEQNRNKGLLQPGVTWP